MRLGTGVTNVVTRHPAVTAKAILTLNVLSQGSHAVLRRFAKEVIPFV